MVEIFYLAVALVSLISLFSWRTGIYLAILFDVIRDPVRKLSADQSVLVTVSVCVIWGAVFLGLVISEMSTIRVALSRYPSLRRGITWLILAVIPGALIATVFYVGGYKLAIIGGISYLAPLMGIAIGFAFSKTEADLKRVLGFYIVINSVALIGTVLEWKKSAFPGLGGIDMEWIRHHGQLQVELIAGFFRSPDIMGLHAAHVLVFCVILAMQSKSIGKAGWTGLAGWAAFCLLLSGRRKMIGIPLVFTASFILISYMRGSRGASKLGGVIAILAILGAFVTFSNQDVQNTSDYQEFASTLFTRGAERSNELISGSILWTLKQSGFLGSGLGSATQGSHYANVVNRSSSWQEDGISRIFKELGIIGVICLGIALLNFLQTVVKSIRLIPPNHSLQSFQIALVAVVLGNLASFTISHQQYSGDPVNAIMVLFLLGTVLGMPRLHAKSRRPHSSSMLVQNSDFHIKTVLPSDPV